jgi:hypothetical protein
MLAAKVVASRPSVPQQLGAQQLAPEASPVSAMVFLAMPA